MKYIRTKDGAIYEIADNKYLLVEDKKMPLNMSYVKETCICADTIEELCDCFVIHVRNYFYDIEYDLQDALYDFDKETDVIYGDIWTSKGLIYVAKMNEKGELVLI